MTEFDKMRTVLEEVDDREPFPLVHAATERLADVRKPHPLGKAPDIYSDMPAMAAVHERHYDYAVDEDTLFLDEQCNNGRKREPLRPGYHHNGAGELVKDPPPRKDSWNDSERYAAYALESKRAKQIVPGSISIDYEKGTIDASFEAQKDDVDERGNALGSPSALLEGLVSHWPMQDSHGQNHLRTAEAVCDAEDAEDAEASLPEEGYASAVYPYEPPPRAHTFCVTIDNTTGYEISRDYEALIRHQLGILSKAPSRDQLEALRGLVDEKNSDKLGLNEQVEAARSSRDEWRQMHKQVSETVLEEEEENRVLASRVASLKIESASRENAACFFAVTTVASLIGLAIALFNLWG